MHALRAAVAALRQQCALGTPRTLQSRALTSFLVTCHAGILGGGHRWPTLAVRRHRRERWYSCHMRRRAAGWRLDDVGLRRCCCVAYLDATRPER